MNSYFTFQLTKFPSLIVQIGQFWYIYGNLLAFQLCVGSLIWKLHTESEFESLEIHYSLSLNTCSISLSQNRKKMDSGSHQVDSISVFLSIIDGGQKKKTYWYGELQTYYKILIRRSSRDLMLSFSWETPYQSRDTNGFKISSLINSMNIWLSKLLLIQ